jgi:hypothetical protein
MSWGRSYDYDQHYEREIAVDLIRGRTPDPKKVKDVELLAIARHYSAEGMRNHGWGQRDQSSYERIPLEVRCASVRPYKRIG